MLPGITASTISRRVPSILGTIDAEDELGAVSNFDLSTDRLSGETWSISAGALPTGWSIDSSTGEVGGTSSAPGTYNFTVQAVGTPDTGYTNTATRAFTVKIGALWTPANLASVPLAWYDDTSNVTNVSGACSQWDDISGAALHLGQSTSTRRPIINAADADIGNKRSLSFDGSNDSLFVNSAGAQNLMKNIGSGWLLSVHRKTASAINSALAIYIPTSGGPTRLGMAVSNSAGLETIGFSGRRLDADSTQGTSSDATEYGNQWVIAIGAMDYTARTATLYVDGALKNSASGLWSGGGNTSNTNPQAQALTIGANNTLTASNADMKMAAAIIGRTLPTAAEIDKLFGWAAHQYSLQAVLPADHPYKTFPPVQG